MDAQQSIANSAPRNRTPKDGFGMGQFATGIDIANVSLAVGRRAGPDTPSTGLLPVVTITCIGYLRVHLSAEPVNLHGKALELLAYLGTRPSLRAGHEALLDALWPDHDTLRAERLLYTAVWKARSILDISQAMEGPLCRQSAGQRWVPRTCSHRQGKKSSASVLLNERGYYSLNPVRCHVDVARLVDQTAKTEADIQDGAREDIAATWLALPQPDPHRLLVGESFEWLSSFREDQRKSYEQILVRALACAKRTGDSAAMLEALHRLLGLDPLREDIVAHAMRLHLARGETAAAACCYRDFVVALRREYGEYGNYGLRAASGGKKDDQATFGPSHELRALYSRAAAYQRDVHDELHTLGPPTP